jgi:DNA-binding NarL/FixJ family response regulator
MIIKCIIVEDFEPLNNIYYNLLNYEGDIQVVGRAYDSNELFEIIKNTAVDVVLLDIEMTGRLDGINSCKRLLKEYPNLSVIMLSCHEEEEIILSAFEAGAMDYVLKTSSSAKILEAVRAAYNKDSPINPYAASLIRKRMKEFSNFKEGLLYMMNIVSTLTYSEVYVLKLLMKSKKQREIAEIRNVEIVTVKAHVSSILKKFNMERTVDIIKVIKEMGMDNFIENMNSK